MLSSENDLVFKNSSNISFSYKTLLEINYNSAILAEKYGCYKTTYSSTYDSTNASSLYDDGKFSKFFSNDGALSEYEDKEKNELVSISSIFKPNRPDAGIVNLVSYRGAELMNAGTLKVGNFGNANHGERTPRVYPMSKNSKFRYWSSAKTINSAGDIELVGISASDSTIEYAAPFVVYSESFWVNKLVFKVQNHLAFPVSYTIDVLLDGETEWTTLVTATNDTSSFESGKLELYYMGEGFTSTPVVATDLVEPTDSIQIYGVRLAVTKMSDARVPLEVIEISPRLEIDISNYTLSFDKTTAIESSVSGSPSTGIVSSSANLSLFNQDKMFSPGTENSIISKYLYQGLQIKVYQILDTEEIPLGVFYTSSWNDSGKTEVSTSMEDYFYFLKRQSAPNIMIANKSGVETSVAMLILLDNAGITNYEFIKAYEDSRDDFIMDYFFCSEEQTIADVLAEIAVSAQISIYVDVNNTIKAIPKEGFNANRAITDTDYWIVGTEDWDTKTEAAYLSNYSANAISFVEEKIKPITEVSIQYSGNGITRQPKAVLKTPELLDDTNNGFYNASIVSRDLSYVNTQLWSVDSEEGSDKVLLSMPYISELTTTRPSVISANRNAININEAIRAAYAEATATEKKYFEIVLDQERGIEFLQSAKFNGYVSVNSELIKYNGIVVDVFDPNNSLLSGRKVVFSKDESQYLINSASSGVSVTVYSILVEIVYAPVSNVVDASSEIEYRFVSDGRGQENTSITTHTASSDTSFSTAFSTRLFAADINASIKASATIKSESVNPLDPRLPDGPKTYSYPGYLKLSGPKGIVDGNQKSGIASALTGKAYLPIDNYGERIITGVYKEIEDFVPNVISTRMRLLSKPAKKQSTKKSDAVSPENRGIAGLAFRLNTDGDCTTGYFLEIEDVGNITGKQLKNEQYTNMRLYRVDLVGGVYVPTVLKTAWVNVNATAGESLDLSNALETDGKSYASTSDVLITTTETTQSYIYRVYWETNLVMKVTESKNDSINTDSKKVGVMSRFDSVALFDHILCLGVSKNGGYTVPAIFNDGSEYVKAVEAAERGNLPSVVADSSVKNSDLKFFFEDFGNQLREAKRFNIKWKNPSAYASVISLDKLNKEYKVSAFSSTSYTADFWVFNTSRSSIGLSLETSTPIIISGIALEELNPGEILLSNYLKNKSSKSADELLFNKNKYGETLVSIDGKFLNNLSQAENLLEWIWEKRSFEKKRFSMEIFPNPLLELGDKVRIFNSDIDHTIEKIGDRCYYITNIGYSFSSNGPSMTIGVEEA